MFRNNQRKEKNNMADDVNELAEERKYKSFAETFKLVSFSLATSMMYPRRSNERVRNLLSLLILSTFLPALLMFLDEIYSSIHIVDMDNITRQTTLGIPFTILIIKIILAHVKRREFETVLNQISSDLIAANDLNGDNQKIVDQFVRSGKTAQTVWTVNAVMVTWMFPLMAAVLMVNHNLKHNEIKRFMLHDMKFPGLGEKRYDSPYFEIIFAYMLYLSFLFTINFIAFDGSFCVCVNHASLKLKLMALQLGLLFEDEKDLATIKRGMRQLIVDHQTAYEYISLVQRIYGPWLTAVFLFTFLQICVTLYQVTEVSIDPKYMIFVVGSVIHIYIPCHFSAVLQQTALESSTEIYCCGWEKILDKWVMDTVRFMIARAQCPVILTAMGMVTFDMLLFVSMLQTSYSMFTLLTSK